MGVSAEFDFNLLPFYRLQGQEIPQLPGLLTVLPPKRAARGREEDRLLVYLTLSGNTRFSTTEYNQIMNQTTQRFYQTTGSLTSALRTAAGELNQFLLNRNLHTTGKGEYMVGRLILGVLRGGTQFVFAQCGPTHVFHLAGNETRQIHDEQIAGRGLGIGQTAPLHFAQTDLHAGDSLILCPNLPNGTDATILEQKNTSFESLRRFLPSLPGDELNAVLVQVLAGKGNLNVLKGTPAAAERPAPSSPAAAPELPTQPGQPVPSGTQPEPDPATPQAASSVPDPSPPLPARSTSRVESEIPASRFARLLASADGSTTPLDSSNPDALPKTAGASVPPQTTGAPGTPTGQPVRVHPSSIPVTPTLHPVRRTGRFVSSNSRPDLPEIKRPASRHRREFFGGLARIIQGVRAGSQKISLGARKFLPKVLPETEAESEIAGSSLAIFAIIIPVIIVVVAATVYLHYGRTAQYQQNYDMALAQAAQARGQTNPTDVRRAWDSTIYYLNLADKSQKTQDSQNLRQQAQMALDNLDGILRLDFRPAIIGGLGRNVQVSQIAATDTDLYLLDSARGAVLRATVTAQGYEVDPSFKCDPGDYGTLVVGTLVDLEVLPMSNDYNASVLAIDGKGNLLYCGVADPVAVALVPPQLGLRSITAFSLDANGRNLYVLDPAGNAIWKYSGNLGKFTDLPVMFFGTQVPENMNTSIDLAANNSDLYILFQDGHVSSCPLVSAASSPMRCTDPATFVDTRPERQPGPKINDAIFSQITFASAPDPSVYLLEPLTRAIYRFSPRPGSLELRGQFRATIEQSNAQFNGPATAMTISSNRYAFFSVGNQVYFATDVP